MCIQHIFESRAVFRATFRVTGGYMKAGTSFLKRIIGRIFRISDSKEASRNFFFYFFPKKAATIPLLQDNLNFKKMLGE
jgi:hypothetical protein